VKALMNVCVVSAMLALPAAAFAQTDTTPKTDTSQKAPAGMNCPMMGDMKKNVGTMMMDMSAMMGRTSNPSMKAQMQKMHDQMSAMMENMQKMGGGMTQGGQKSGDGPTTPASPTAEDHKAHHPDQ